jgi:hypothetical protein
MMINILLLKYYSSIKTKTWTCRVIALHEESEDDELDSRASSGRTILGKMFAGSEEKNAEGLCILL